jgi:hypothetical protein
VQRGEGAIGSAEQPVGEGEVIAAAGARIVTPIEESL